jgi:tetrahydromethanopterin S-methyltransferase subunit B
MRNIYLLTIAFLFTSCMAKVVEKEEPIVETTYDSVLIASEKLHDSILVYIPSVDEKIEKLEKNIAHNVEELKKENESLKKEALVVKTITVRDTVYIKEKTNFWGKKKVTTDSAQSVDSTVIEHEND